MISGSRARSFTYDSLGNTKTVTGYGGSRKELKGSDPFREFSGCSTRADSGEGDYLPMIMATASKGFIKGIFELADAKFCKAGWTKRKPDIFSLDLSEDGYGRVGLNKAIGRGNGILEINPIVGVGSHKLERFWMEMIGQKFQPYIGAAIGRNVGYLTPEKKYRPWLFREEDNCEALLDDMVATVQKYGRPFMREHLELPALCEAMRHSKLGGPQDQYRIPATLVLLGKNAEAETFLEAKLKEMAGRSDLDAESFRRFAVKLREAFKP